MEGTAAASFNWAFYSLSGAALGFSMRKVSIGYTFAPEVLTFDFYNYNFLLELPRLMYGSSSSLLSVFYGLFCKDFFRND